MKPSLDRRLPSVQVLRGIAASLVVFHHCALAQHQVGAQSSWIYNSGLWRVGACGVDIFFVISGFIMVYTTAGNAGLRDSRIFLKRRSTRIYPVYWIFTTCLLLEWLIGAVMKVRHFSPFYILSSYLLYPSFNGRNYEPLLSQGWTLSFEMLFYVVFSLAIALGIRRTKLPLLGGAFLVLAAVGQLFPKQSGIRHLFTEPLIFEFLMGVLLGELFLRLIPSVKQKLERWLPIPLILVGSCALLLTVRLSELGSMRFVYFGLSSLLVVTGACLLGSSPAPRLLVFLGDASYSIYLVHSFFLSFFHTLLKHFSIGPYAIDPAIVVASLLIIACSSLAYLMVERPLQRRLSRKPAPLPLDAPAARSASVTNVA